MQQILRLCEEIEQLVAQVYRYWQQAYVNDPGLSQLWERMANDELDHVKQVQLARRLPSDMVFNEPNISRAGLERLHAMARKLLDDIKINPIPAEKALQIAIRMEEEFSRVHVQNAADIKDEAMRQMFSALARADEEHVATLRNYVDSVSGQG